MTANVPVADAGFFANAKTQQWVAVLALRMLDGMFLYEGGAQYNASFGGERMRTGYDLLRPSSGAKERAAEIRCMVTDPAGKVVLDSSDAAGDGVHRCRKQRFLGDSPLGPPARSA